MSIPSMGIYYYDFEYITPLRILRNKQYNKKKSKFRKTFGKLKK